jgi:phosphoribulokinase
MDAEAGDKARRGYSTEAVTDTSLRRMRDYVHYVWPQFTYTHVNFQRVPVVDTSNPFIARFIRTLDESMLVIRFANVCAGGKIDGLRERSAAQSLTNAIIGYNRGYTTRH